jgi:hypothetical protein
MRSIFYELRAAEKGEVKVEDDEKGEWERRRGSR